MTVNYEKFHLKKVINASGKMTILGVSQVSEKVLAAQRFGGENFFEMEHLIKETGTYIASLLQVEAAQIVSCASAGIAQAVAAVIGQGSLYHAYHPYAKHLKKREILLPKGHNIDYGTPIEVMVELGGGQVVEAGYANTCTPMHLEMFINENTAAILYIKSHHTVQKSMLSITEAANLAKKYNLPLIVDAAAEEDLLKYYQQGADLVIYSGAKAIEGPSAGLVIGKKKLIDWIYLQSHGIGRAMKIGKENILGFTQAIEDYLKEPQETGVAMQARLIPFIDALNELPHLTAKMVRDGADRDIYRASVQITGEKNANQVITALKNQNTAIYTREYQANHGIIEFDIRAVKENELQQIVATLQQILSE